MCSQTETQRKEIRKKYHAKVPEALTSQFVERRSKEEAIKHHEERKQTRTELFPDGKKPFFSTISYFSVHLFLSALTRSAVNTPISFFMYTKHVDFKGTLNHNFFSYSITPNQFTYRKWQNVHNQTKVGQRQKKEKEIKR